MMTRSNTAYFLALASLAGLLVGCDAGSATVPTDLPTCSATAITGAACQGSDPLCMGCSQGAAYTCGCTDAGPDDDGGTRWLCVGAEQDCP